MRNILEYTATYSEEKFEEYQSKYRKKIILETIEKYKPNDILEIGCGLEPIYPYISYKHNMMIVEPSEEFYSIAAMRFKTDQNVTCICDYLENVELAERKFDLILCSSLLHEVEKPMELLEKISSIASKDTIIHFNVPNANSLHRIIALEAGLISNQRELSNRNKDLQQNNVFDLNTFAMIIENAGFNIMESGTYFIKPFTHRQMYEIIEKGIVEENILEGLFGLSKYLPDYGSEIYINAKKI